MQDRCPEHRPRRLWTWDVELYRLYQVVGVELGGIDPGDRREPRRIEHVCDDARLGRGGGEVVQAQRGRCGSTPPRAGTGGPWSQAGTADPGSPPRALIVITAAASTAATPTHNTARRRTPRSDNRGAEGHRRVPVGAPPAAFVGSLLGQWKLLPSGWELGVAARPRSSSLLCLAIRRAGETRGFVTASQPCGGVDTHPALGGQAGVHLRPPVAIEVE